MTKRIRGWWEGEGDPPEGFVPDENPNDTESESRDPIPPNSDATYEWRALNMDYEEFRCDYYSDYEEGEEPDVPIGYLVVVGEMHMFLQHKHEHGTYPCIPSDHHAAPLQALRNQLNLSPDYKFPDHLTYGYLDNSKRWKGIGG